MKSKKTVKEFILLAGSSMGAQALSIITIPIVARYFSPENFGEYSYIFALSSIVAIFLNGSLSLAVSTSVTRRRSKILAVQVLIISGAVAASSVFALCFIRITGRVDVDIWLYCICLSWIFASSQIALAYAIKVRSVRTVAIASIGKTIAGPTISICLLSAFKESSALLVLGYSFAELGVICIIQLSSSLVDKKTIIYSFVSKFKAVGQHLRQITHYMPSQLIALATNFIPMLTLREMAAPLLLGHYSMALRMIAVPVNAISSAAKPLYWNLIVASNRHKHVRNATAIFAFSNLIGVVVSCIILLFEMKIFENLLGEKWQGIDAIFPYTFVWVMSSLGRSISTEILRKMHCEKYILDNEIKGFVFKFSVCLILFWSGQSPDFCIRLWLVASFIFNLYASCDDIKRIKVLQK